MSMLLVSLSGFHRTVQHFELPGKCMRMCIAKSLLATDFAAVDDEFPRPCHWIVGSLWDLAAQDFVVVEVAVVAVEVVWAP